MKFTEQDAPETIEFNGTIYGRMGGRRRYYLSQSKSNAGRRQAKGLHVAIWEFYSGKTVPKKHEVHHEDGNTFNFEFKNLECLPTSTHRSMPKKNKWSGNKDHLEKIRPLASEWHKSTEGRQWHRQHAFESIRKANAPKPYSRCPTEIGRCMWCGGKMTIKIVKRKLFCSFKCLTQESGLRRGRYKFIHPNYDPSRRIKSA